MGYISDHPKSALLSFHVIPFLYHSLDLLLLFLLIEFHSTLVFCTEIWIAANTHNFERVATL